MDSLGKFQIDSKSLTPASAISIKSHGNSPSWAADIGTGEKISVQIKEIRQFNRFLLLESYVLENYLKKNDPGLLTGMDEVLETTPGPSKSRMGSAALSLISTGSSPMRYSSSLLNRSAGSRFSNPGIRINVPARIEITKEQHQDLEMALKKFKFKCKRRRYFIMASNQELQLSIAELAETTEQLQEICKSGINKITKRLPAEIVTNFLRIWCRKSDENIAILRLQSLNLRNQLKDLNQKLNRWRDLASNLDSIDFEQLRIKNYEISKTLKLKTRQQEDEKWKFSQAKLEEKIYEKHLTEQSRLIAKYNRRIEFKKDQTQHIRSRIKRVRVKFRKVKAGFDSLKKLHEDYEVPRLMDYILLRAEIADLKQGLKNFTRKREIQLIVLQGVKKSYSQLTSNNPSASLSPKNIYEVNY